MGKIGMVYASMPYWAGNKNGPQWVGELSNVRENGKERKSEGYVIWQVRYFQSEISVIAKMSKVSFFGIRLVLIDNAF